MSEQLQPNEPDKGPQIKAELQDSDITMKISKAKKKKEQQAIPKPELPYLDDHVETYGKNLMSSIANLIEQSKQEKPKRKKKQMTEAQLEQCRRNLAKGRETIRKKKEALSQNVQPKQHEESVEQTIVKQHIVASIPTPSPKPVVHEPVKAQPVYEPMPAPVYQPPQPPERIRLRYGARLF